MKKIIILILTLALCLSLAACDGGETPNTNENNGTNQENNNGANNETTESPHANHPHLAYIYGQWELRKKESYSQPISCHAVTINEDGTSIVDGVSGTWEISNETRDDFLKINIFIEGEHRFIAAYYSNHHSIAVWGTDYMGGAVDACWVNMTTTEAITLTTENWREYFELVTESNYEKDAFGELDRLVLVQYLILKEEYANMVWADNVAIELTGTTNRYSITLDTTNESYALGEVVGEGKIASMTITLKQQDINDNKIAILCRSSIQVDDNADPGSPSSKTVSIIPSFEDIEFLRVQGTIYVLKQ